MNFELVDLKAFVAVAELGSFNRAAELLNLSQPALSRRIQKLEDTLGVALFERSTRHVALTMVGRDFMPKVRRFLDEFESSLLGISDLGARSGGQITIASVPTAVFYFLPNAISRFSVAFPRIRIRILDLGANEGLEAVARGEADFGINFIGTSHPDIEFTPLAEDPFVVACRHDHPLAARREVGWDELAAHRVITVGRTSGNRALIDNALAQHGLKLNWSYEITHLASSLGLVEAGLGVAVLPKLATPASGHPIIRTIPLSHPKISRTIGVVRRHGAILSPMAARFLEVLLGSWKA
ncbi:LysR family transcriptional regulator (plasmid) [Azospirillum baldaniorum]|uniref:DNA-binding transcriptional regulator n=1 Tax=Azospirillum baldaniorum TaxID=1064539 RepID=A0A9P1JZD5_9PROT|nr:LysR family transcriptional regulator [Azospirillum baldaniorum]TWA78157.1 DNA-binding transcriptional LysR family regulator [Azospirillum brasilense]AWJ92745.1 LysR family transcriptional regulator [Azospirillum baldaniorum]NUB05021.1 LysR family transcriptional regulator [Azospirillum baldaniorum]TWA63606.1 DNA-binding transcriptional LysR family regulator [Azospirillum baldaniorum]CCD02727.1 putative DNA-binding transcriptional regulator [Azospirillum baldaniorum]